MSKELVQAMKALEEEKDISSSVIKEALETALVLAYKKNYDEASNVEVNFDEQTGEINVYSVKEVVEECTNPTLEISLADAHAINQAYEVGDQIKSEVTPADFGRIATQTAKHVIMQRIREAEREIIYNEYSQYEDEIMVGTVERQDQRFVFVNLGRAEAIMPEHEQIPTEEFEMDERIKVYVVSVEKSTRGPQITVSRAHVNFLKRLFEQEIPEIYDGTVEIMSIAREAGERAKVAVYSRDPNIDPVGTAVGQGGQRVQSIVYELNGENMDIIEWDEDPAVFVSNAMNPADVVHVDFNEDDHSCVVVVPEYQLSLAIGKRGQNARLAARLTGYKIDIKSEEDYAIYLEEKAQEEAEAALEEVSEVVDELVHDVEDVVENVQDDEEVALIDDVDAGASLEDIVESVDEVVHEAEDVAENVTDDVKELEIIEPVDTGASLEDIVESVDEVVHEVEGIAETGNDHPQA